MKAGDLICSGETVKPTLRNTGGFTAMELMVGVSLAVLITLGVGPLVVSIQSSSSLEGDRSVAVLQGRVAAARLERDLRMATAEGCPFEVEGPILQASDRQIVFLSVCSDTETLLVVEWELAGSVLMRRWRVCPTEKPVSLVHALYIDNKTMLEGVGADATFTYALDDGYPAADVAERDLFRVAIVSLSCSGIDRDGTWATLAEVKARVGR